MFLSPEKLPTPKEEAWKYTNLPRALPEGLTREEDAAAIVIHKNRGQICEQSEDILFTGRDGFLHSPVLKVVLEEGAELTLIERHEGRGAYWKNMSIEIELAAGAKLNHYRLIEDSVEGVLTLRTHVTQKKDSAYNSFSLLTGSKLTRNEFHSEIEESNVTTYFNGINLLSDNQHGDTTILVEHKAPHCISSQLFRSVLADKARGVFQGKVHVHRPAQKTDAYQLSNALLLSDSAEMDTKPELEIYADDVKCSHGATTGQLEDNALFYLRSRGLSEAQARQLLIQAFVDEVADKIEDENFRKEVKGKTEKWLQQVL
jgi:Fe-S cluster assembly protein SufD